MTDYISRETAVKIVEKYGLAEGSTLGHHSGIADCIADEISHAPAADVAPVRHGHWMSWKETFRVQTKVKNRRLGVCCSACESHSDTPRNFCPECGAKMDGEVHDICKPKT